MRLVCYTHGRMKLVPLSGTRAYSRGEVEEMISARVASGRGVALDFSGEFIPLSVPEEAPLVASLVVAYHNSVVTANVEVRSAPPAGGPTAGTANVRVNRI